MQACLHVLARFRPKVDIAFPISSPSFSLSLLLLSLSRISPPHLIFALSLFSSPFFLSFSLCLSSNVLPLVLHVSSRFSLFRVLPCSSPHKMDPLVSVRVPTPDTSHVGLHKTFPDVYEAAEDSFLFLDALAEDLPFLLRRRPSLVLEMGSGSGCVISFLRTLFLRAFDASSRDALSAKPAKEEATVADANNGGTTTDAHTAHIASRPSPSSSSPSSPSSSPSSSSSSSPLFIPCFFAVDCNLSATEATLETARRSEKSESRDCRAATRLRGRSDHRDEAPESVSATSPDRAESCRCAVDAVASDLFRAFRPSERRKLPSSSSSHSPSSREAGNASRHEGLFDVVLFNPPYVPGSPRERPRNPADWAWWGGEDGREVIDQFLRQVTANLTAAGVLYLVLEKRNRIDQVVAHMEAEGFAAKQVKRRKIHGGEDLSVWRFTRF
ncbi:methyltransferase domain protein [Toxoplasma gondii RUB]|nr:methyltransferase domain protein [Toxoplasma gondii RUB]